MKPSSGAGEDGPVCRTDPTVNHQAPSSLEVPVEPQATVADAIAVPGQRHYLSQQAIRRPPSGTSLRVFDHLVTRAKEIVAVMKRADSLGIPTATQPTGPADVEPARVQVTSRQPDEATLPLSC